MPEFFSQNFLSANSDSKSFGGHQIGSSSHSPPPTRLIMVKVDSGCDIIESILDVARQNETSLAIKSACGTIASMTLCNITDVPVTMVYGPFNILSLNGSYLYDNQYTLLSEATHPPSFYFGIHISTSHGHVFCGNIGGPVIADKDVILTILTFKNPKIYRYVLENNESNDDEDNTDDDDNDDEDDNDINDHDDNNNNKDCNDDLINFNNEGDLSTFNADI